MIDVYFIVHEILKANKVTKEIGHNKLRSGVSLRHRHNSYCGFIKSSLHTKPFYYVKTQESLNSRSCNPSRFQYFLQLPAASSLVPHKKKHVMAIAGSL